MGSFRLLKGGVEIMEQELKFRVIRLFLQFIQQYVPLSEVVIASMGGEGREAAIWEEEGVPGTNGRFVERNKKRSQRLISGRKYKYASSLKSLPRVIRSAHGSEHGLDAFHLDLCGTLENRSERYIEIVRPLIPLIVNSTGRCLAITVADARDNASVRNFDAIETQLRALLGDSFDQLRERLQSEWPTGREQAVMRELGFFFHIMKLFRFYATVAVPNKVKRFAYISRTTGYSFPMRTYFFHFREEKRRMTDRAFALALFKRWLQEPLEDFADRPPVIPSEPKETSIMSEKYALLKGLASTVGGQLADEIKSVLAAAEANSKYGELVQQLRSLLPEHTAPLLPPTEKRGRRGKTGGKKSAVADGEFLKGQVELVLARAKSEKAYEKIRVGVGKRFAGKGKKATYVARAMFAQTQGKHRASFLRRLGQAHPELFNEDLADAYKTALSDLRTEAGI